MDIFLEDSTVDLSRVLAWQRYFRALPRRTRRALQRTCKQSFASLALLCALGPAPTEAAIIPVSATCSLVNAIRAANTNTAQGGCPRGSGADTIRLPVGSTQTLTAVNNTTFGPTGLPVISSAITIEGRNSTIRRGSTAPDFRIFAIGSTGNLTLQETTISGGRIDGKGGGALNYGVMTLTNSTVSESGSTYPGGRGDGGGVFSAGRLTITNSSVSGGVEFGGGGGISNTGALTITNSRIRGTASYGAGGGISNTGTLIITNSSISGSCRASGGGISNGGSGILTLMNSTISGSTIGPHGGGGGIVNGNYATMTITNSTISDNYGAFYGGGILNSGSASIINSTISGNSANEGGGVFNSASSRAALTLARTLVSGNVASDGPEIHNSSSGTVTANAFNLFGHDGNAGVSGFTPGPRDIVPTAPLSAILNPTLANNGRSTLTHALVPGSPALNAVRTGCPPPATDQRGVPRPHGPRCDIGAFEAVFCGDSPVTILGTPGNDVLTGTAGKDVMIGLGGNDTLAGLGGDDVLCGGEGNDTLRGNSGADLLFGELGDDWVFAGPGQDQLFGQRGRDQLFGGLDNDSLDGGPDDDGLNGEAGVDRCDGGLHARGDTAVNCETIFNIP